MIQVFQIDTFSTDATASWYLWNTKVNPSPPGHFPSWLDDQTLTPCGHWEACRSSSRWHGRQHPESQSGRKRSPWIHFHHTPPGEEGHVRKHRPRESRVNINRWPSELSPCRRGCCRKQRKCRTVLCCRWTCQGSWWTRCPLRTSWGRGLSGTTWFGSVSLWPRQSSWCPRLSRLTGGNTE